MDRHVKAAARFVLKVAYYPLILPSLWVISRLTEVKFTVLRYERIGHLAYDTDLYRRRRELLNGRERPPKVIFVSGVPANRYLLAFWQRKFTIIESSFLTWAFFTLRPHLQRTNFIYENVARGNEHFEFSVGSPVTGFTSEELARGQIALRNMGIGPDDWYVCLHTRNSSYLKQMDASQDWSRHDYRDVDIHNYMKAAEYITSQGGFVIRMGTPSEVPLVNVGNPRIIDYAMNFHSEFLDIFLPATCRFFLGSSSGMICIPLLFNRPLVATNYIPYRYIGVGQRAIYTPKLLRRGKGGDLVPFEELRALGAYRTDTEKSLGNGLFAEAGFEWVENDENDILGACKDMFDVLQGDDISKTESGISREYKKFLKDTDNYSRYAGTISPSFAEKYKHLF